MAYVQTPCYVRVTLQLGRLSATVNMAHRARPSICAMLPRGALFNAVSNLATLFGNIQETVAKIR